MPAAPTGSGDLWFVQDGAGSDVLLVPGLGDGTDAWAGHASGLARLGRRVTRYDPRGFARSSAAGDPADVGRLAADALAVLDAAGVAQADVVGGAVGALAALELAVLAPDRVRSLVLAGTWARADRRLRALLSGWAAAASRAAGADELLGLVLGVATGPDRWESGLVDTEITATARAVGTGVGWTRYQAAFAATARAALHHDARATAGAVEAPTLLLTGALDAVAPERYARELRTLLPGAGFELVAGVGHRVLHERPDVITGAVLGWIERARLARAA